MSRQGSEGEEGHRAESQKQVKGIWLCMGAQMPAANEASTNKAHIPQPEWGRIPPRISGIPPSMRLALAAQTPDEFVPCQFKMASKQRAGCVCGDVAGVTAKGGMRPEA